jgi:hypothetical protein
MSRPTTNSARNAHRAQIVSEAVVSGYINEIATPRRRHTPAPAPRARPVSTELTARSPLVARTRGRALRPHRRPALELGA